MQGPKTHFEQIPLETVKKNVEAQSRQGELVGQILTPQNVPNLIASPTSMPPNPSPGGTNANDHQKTTKLFKSEAKNKTETR
jgi:hypothetical protein